MNVNSSIEKFIIELGFDDKEALKGLKSFLGKVDQANKKTLKQLEKVKQKQASGNQDLTKTNKLLREQTKLRNKITQASKLGIDTTSDERSLSRAVKPETLAKRYAELDDKVSKARLGNRKEEIKMSEQERMDSWFKTSNEKLKLDKKAQQERLKQARANSDKIVKLAKKEQARIAKIRKDALKRQLAAEEKMHKFFSSQRFKDFERANPKDASRYRQRGMDMASRAGGLGMDSKELSQLNRKMDSFRSSVQRTTRVVSRHSRAMIGLQTVQHGLKDSTRHLIRSYASLFTIMAGTTAINTIGQDFQTMSASMLLASGTAEKAAVDLKFVRDEAMRLGLDLRQATDGFVKLKFAASGKISNEDINQLFTGYSEFARAVGVDKFRTEKGLQALQQMINKGQVMAEELKQQLAEQVPGSLKVFEKALGVSSKELFELMERGELLAEDVLPLVGRAFAEMARQGGALEQQLKTSKTTQGQFILSLQEAADVIFKSGFEEGISGLFKTLTQEILESRKSLEALGKIFKWFFDTVGLGAKILMPVIDSIVYVFGEFAQIINSVNKLLGNNLVTTLGIIGTALFGIYTIFNRVGKKTGDVAKKGGMLALIFKPWLLILLGVAGILDEIFSLFEKGRIGLLEKYLFGEDLDLSLADLKKGIMSLSGVVGDALGNVNFTKMSSNLTQSIIDALMDVDIVDTSFFDWFTGGWLLDVDWEQLGSTVIDVLSKVVKTVLNMIINTLSSAVGIFSGIFDKVFDTDKFTDNASDSESHFKKALDMLLPTGSSNSLPKVPAKSGDINISTDIKIDMASGSPEEVKKVIEEIDRKLSQFWTKNMAIAQMNGVN